MKRVPCLVSVFVSAFLLTLVACEREDVALPPGLPYTSNFGRSGDNWQAGLADFSPAQDTSMRFSAALTSLPSPLDKTQPSIKLESMNRSDDAFMFIKRKVAGLQPNTDYSLLFEIELASSEPANSFGIGGSPGSSVFLKAGASAIEPVVVLQGDHYVMNIDKGNQATEGKEAIVLGNVSNGKEEPGYVLVNRSNKDQAFTARSNAQGELWLIVGTDSGYEGLTTLYYKSIKVSIR